MDNFQNPNPAPSAMPNEPVPAPIPVQTESKLGPIIGIVIVILVLVLGALYFWGEKLNRESGVTNDVINAEAAESELSTQSSSDELSSIESDLEATDFSELDANLESDFGF